MTRGMKTKLTDAQWKKMGDCASDGCQNGTIAAIMGIAKQTINDSKEIRTYLHKKRALRYRKKRQEQDKHAKTSPIMSIFQGKNELGQADKTEQKTKHDLSDETIKLLDLIDGSCKGVLPGDEN